MSIIEDLDQYRVTHETLTIPNTLYYIPEFINEDEEEYLLNRVDDSSKVKWVYLTNRRLQNWGGYVAPKGLIQEPLPLWLSIYCKKIGQLQIFNNKTPNHVLINEYLPGQGIMPHEDGPAFFPTVTTISLGSSTVLNFYPKKDIPSAANAAPQVADYMTTSSGQSVVIPKEASFSLLIQPRSLLISSCDAYTSYLHGIGDVHEDKIDSKIANLSLCPGVEENDVLTRSKRVSLTIRYVVKVIKASFLIGKR